MGLLRETVVSERDTSRPGDVAGRAFPRGRGLGVSRRRLPDPLEEYLGFREGLRAALRVGTPAAFRSCVRTWASPRDGQLFALIAQPDQVLVPYIKKMILEEPRLADMHEDAQLWLIANESVLPRSRTIAPTDARRTPRPRTPAA